MAGGEVEAREAPWSERLLFLRLFRTFWIAVLPARLGLSLVCVLICYLAGRILDWLWLAAGAGVLVASHDGRPVHELQVHAASSARDFAAWLRAADDENRRLQVESLVQFGAAATPQEARAQLESASARSLIEQKRTVRSAEVRRLIDERRDAAVAALEREAGLSDVDRRRRRLAIERAADCLRFLAAGKPTERYFSAAESAGAVDTLLAADPALEPSARAEHQARLTEFVARERRLIELAQREPLGPFDALMKYEIQCIAGAIEGTCAFRFGLAGDAGGAEPTMLGSLASAGSGLVWLVTQRPLYALLLAAVFCAAFGFFGGAVCRLAALHAARDEQIALRSALRFSWDKLSGFVSVPVIPIGLFVLVAVLMILGGIVAAIPFVGEIFAGVFYFLALLGGFVLALLVIGAVLGFPLMWPTIAVEGSDSFDATARSFGYVGQRTWLAAFYGIILLAYGGVCLVMVRLIAMLTLKLTHSMTDWGMSIFGLLDHSARTGTFSKLQAMWQMPAWSDLTLIPMARSADRFWGSFGGVPLGSGESVGAFLISIWVYLVVGAVAAFAVSFFLCGSTQVYYLLRQAVDSTDLEEVFTDDDSDELFESPESPAPPPEAPGAPGTPLPVVTPPPDA